MRRAVLLSIAWVLLVTGVQAEPVYFIWREPTTSGTLAFTTVYWCRGVSCTNWQTDEPLKCLSDNGVGGDPKKKVLLFPLVQGTLPVTVRFKVTATDTLNNETSGTMTSHTFSAE